MRLAVAGPRRADGLATACMLVATLVMPNGCGGVAPADGATTPTSSEPQVQPHTGRASATTSSTAVSAARAEPSPTPAVRPDALAPTIDDVDAATEAARLVIVGRFAQLSISMADPTHEAMMGAMSHLSLALQLLAVAVAMPPGAERAHAVADLRDAIDTAFTALGRASDALAGSPPDLATVYAGGARAAARLAPLRRTYQPLVLPAVRAHMPVMQHVLERYDPRTSHEDIAAAVAAWERFAASLGS